MNHLWRRMVCTNQHSRFHKNIQVCSDWAAITQLFDELPKPQLTRDAEGERYETGWIFRGHKSEDYRLEPTIERAYPYQDWPEVEYKLLKEFQSKARMHMDPSQLPKTSPRHKLSWLAIMQHFGVPTRLLDFTYSPYVALYFALRNREKGQSAFAEVWGIDATALRGQASKAAREADDKVRQRQSVPSQSHKVSFRLADFASSLQMAQEEDAFWDKWNRKALNPCGIVRQYFSANGFVSRAEPPVQNRRLSSTKLSPPIFFLSLPISRTTPSASTWFNLGMGATTDYDISRNGSTIGVNVDPSMQMSGGGATTQTALWVTPYSLADGSARTVVNRRGIYVAPGQKDANTSVTNDFGIYVDSPTNGTANAAALFAGQVLIGRSLTTPSAVAFSQIGSDSVTSSNYDITRGAGGGEYGIYLGPSMQMTGNQTNQWGEYLRANSLDDGNPRTLTNQYNLYIDAGQKGSNTTVTNAYGLYVAAPTIGSTANVAAYFGGNVGIGLTAPAYTLDVKGTAGASNPFNVASSTGTSELMVSNAGNVGIGTTTPTLGPLTMNSGAYVTSGGVWTNASDRNLKENFTTVSPETVLQKINSLPIQEWNYKSEDPSIKHIGPVAQDFYAAFNIGNNNTSISTIDPSGIALLGIQALSQRIDAIQAFSSSPVIHDTSGPFSDLSNLGNLVVGGIVHFTEIITEKLMAKQVQTDKLCVGSTCVTEAEFLKMVQSSGATPSTPAPTRSTQADETTQPAGTQETASIPIAPQQSTSTLPTVPDTSATSTAPTTSDSTPIPSTTTTPAQ